MSNLQPVMEIKSLSKSFGPVQAVKDLSLTLEAGKIYGLLGRNGAGKTTLLNLITSRLYSKDGDIRLFGEPGVDNQEALSRICCMPEKNLFPPGMRVKDILRQSAGFYPNFDPVYAAELSRRFELNTQLKYKALSRGYESILRIVIGLAARCELTLFDEPVLGLDAAGRDLFYKTLIQDYSEHPRTFVVSTHLIDESADIFEDAIIIKEGRLIACDSVDVLKKQAVVLSGRKDTIDALVQEHSLKPYSREAVGQLAAVTVAAPLPDEMVRAGQQAGIDFEAVSLQKLFIHLTQPSERQVS